MFSKNLIKLIKLKKHLSQYWKLAKNFAKMELFWKKLYKKNSKIINCFLTKLHKKWIVIKKFSRHYEIASFFLIQFFKNSYINALKDYLPITCEMGSNVPISCATMTARNISSTDILLGCHMPKRKIIRRWLCWSL